MKVTDPKPDQTIDVAPGEMLELALPENPTTGYRWVLAEGPSDLQQESDTYRVIGRAIGAGGVRSLSYTLSKPGIVQLIFQLRRPRQDRVESERKITVRVR